VPPTIRNKLEPHAVPHVVSSWLVVRAQACHGGSRFAAFSLQTALQPRIQNLRTTRTSSQQVSRTNQLRLTPCPLSCPSVTSTRSWCERIDDANPDTATCSSGSFLSPRAAREKTCHTKNGTFGERSGTRALNLSRLLLQIGFFASSTGPPVDDSAGNQYKARG